MDGGDGVAAEQDELQAKSDAGHDDASPPRAFYWWLHSLRADLLAGNSLRLAELQSALEQKHRTVLLTSDQALLRGALALHSFLGARQDQSGSRQVSDAGALTRVLDIHREHLSDSASSSLDVRVYAAYASLLARLHQIYTQSATLDHQDDDEGDDFTTPPPCSAPIDLVRDWTGILGAPTFHFDGTYATFGSLSVPTRQQAFAAGVEAEWDVLLSVENVRDALCDANSKIAGDAMHSQRVWLVLYRFEKLTQAAAARITSKKPNMLENLFLARLRTPHAQIDATAQAFSTYVTKTLPPAEYESTMAGAYALVGKARAVLDVCQPHEQAVQSSMDVSAAAGLAARWAAWKPYTSWAAAQAAGGVAPHRKAAGGVLDTDTVCSLHERALIDCGLPPACAEESMSYKRPPMTKEELANVRGRESREQRKDRIEREAAASRADQDAAADLWMSYLHFLSSVKASATLMSDVCRRAGLALPSHGPLLASILRSYARMQKSDAQIDQFFSKALSNADVRSNGSSVTDVFLARIDVERYRTAHRLVLHGQSGSLSDALASLAKQSDTFMNVFGIMSYGLDTIASANVHDESLRMEQLVTDWCLQGGPETAALAEDCWQRAIRVQPHNGNVWLCASRFALARSASDRAKQLLKQGLARRDVQCNLKIQLAEELERVAHAAGTVQDVDWALRRLVAERERSWTEYYAAYHARPSEVASGAVMDVDMGDAEADVETGGKRKAAGGRGERAVDAEGAERGTIVPHQEKKGRQDEAGKPQRDRENSSVMVDNLPPDATEADLLALFKDCGDIFEITGPRSMSSAERGNASALVEFASREAIPAVRSRDRKPVRSFQVNVQLGYECTLYVTNFPSSYGSDVAIRKLFGPFGRIFDVRWPSKKFAATRRFCYITYCSSAEAQAAQRHLHNIEMTNEQDDGGSAGERGTVRMQVLLSDPNRKKVRTDAFNAELFLSSLPRHATEDDLRALLQPGVRQVRIPKHPDGRNRGIAYVDMDTTLDAQRVLGRAGELDGGGYRLNGKLLTVNLADRSKKDGRTTADAGDLTRSLALERRNCCLRLMGLPIDAQEAIIQQVLEQGCGAECVRRVEWTPGQASGGQALVEFVDAATAGRALLANATKLRYGNGHPLELLPLETRGAAARRPLPATAAAEHRSESTDADPAKLVPRQAGRRGGRGGVGHVRRRTHAPLASMDVDSHGGSERGGTGGQDAFRRMLQ